MSPLRIVAASTLERPALVEAFNAGYRGYEVPMHLDEAAFNFMVGFVDIDLARSVAGYEGERIAAAALLALRGRRAWIGGMGVPPEFRGRGYGTEVMRAAIANARDAGARVMHLEVLVGNAPAIRIYDALGFTPVRRLVVWLLEPAATAAAPPAHDGLVPLDYGAALDLVDHWVTDPAPWQRAPESIGHLPERPAALGLMRDGAVAGAIVYRAIPERASVLALAAREIRREETLAALLDGVRSRHPAAPIRFLNLPEGDPAESVFTRAGARAEARQVEMRLEL